MKTPHPNPLIEGFCRALAKPFSPLEELTIHLEAALYAAKNTRKTEAARMKELRTRIKLMPVDGI
jgi:hypothetical protein